MRKVAPDSRWRQCEGWLLILGGVPAEVGHGHGHGYGHGIRLRASHYAGIVDPRRRRGSTKSAPRCCGARTQ